MTPDTQPAYVPKNLTEKHVLMRVLWWRNILSSPGGPLMGANDSRAVLKIRVISETEDML